MKNAVAFTIADNNNIRYLPILKNSLRKFHTEEELPLIVIGQDQLNLNSDPEKFYKATPNYARRYIDDYRLVLKLDVDQIITHDLKHILSDESFDVGTVLNSNPREMRKWQVGVWDIHPLSYFNCGFVALRSKEFIDHWFSLCNRPNIQNYQYREQDLLNIICAYGNYKVKNLDFGDKFHGLASNSYWSEFVLKGDDIVLPVNKEEHYPDKERIIVSLHFAEGQANPNKGNYRIKCNEDVIKKLDQLTAKNAGTDSPKA